MAVGNLRYTPFIETAPSICLRTIHRTYLERIRNRFVRVNGGLIRVSVISTTIYAFEGLVVDKCPLIFPTGDTHLNTRSISRPTSGSRIGPICSADGACSISIICNLHIRRTKAPDWACLITIIAPCMIFAVIYNNFTTRSSARVCKIFHGNRGIFITFLIGNGLDR